MLELDCLGLEPGSAAAAANQSCLTLSDPMDYIPQGSSVHGILWVRILEWVQFSSVQLLSRIQLFATP